MATYNTCIHCTYMYLKEKRKKNSISFSPISPALQSGPYHVNLSSLQPVSRWFWTTEEKVIKTPTALWLIDQLIPKINTSACDWLSNTKGITYLADHPVLSVSFSRLRDEINRYGEKCAVNPHRDLILINIGLDQQLIAIYQKERHTLVKLANCSVN